MRAGPVSLIEQHSLDELWNHRVDPELHVPFLTEKVGASRHVLDLQGKLDWERPKLHHFPDPETDGKCHLFAAGGVPVDQDIR